MSDVACRNCGTVPAAKECCQQPGRGNCDPSCYYPRDHCKDCPPWMCEDCGEPGSVTEMCSCWIPLEGMPLADIKALFAANDLSLGGLGPAGGGA